MNSTIINDFKVIIEDIKKDIRSTRFKIIKNANFELINLYFRLGKIIDENWKYGNNFINNLSIELNTAIVPVDIYQHSLCPWGKGAVACTDDTVRSHYGTDVA